MTLIVIDGMKAALPATTMSPLFAEYQLVWFQSVQLLISVSTVTAGTNSLHFVRLLTKKEKKEN